MKKFALFFATGAGSGLSPFAPGTAGSLLAAAFLIFFTTFSSPLYILLTLALLIIGIWAAAEAERHYKKEDASQIVIDEIVGMMVSVAFLPIGWKTVLAGFVLFRFFDILKPPPVRQAETMGEGLLKHLPLSERLFQYAGGVGVMMDDVAAGIYTNLSLWGLIWAGVL